MSDKQRLRRLRERYHKTVFGHEPGLDTARRLAVFIGCCFKYRAWPEDVWVTPREIANDLLYNLKKAEMIDAFEYAKQQIYECYDRFCYLRFVDLWVIINHIFPEITYEQIAISRTYRQTVSSSS